MDVLTSDKVRQLGQIGMTWAEDLIYGGLGFIFPYFSLACQCNFAVGGNVFRNCVPKSKKATRLVCAPTRRIILQGMLFLRDIIAAQRGSGSPNNIAKPESLVQKMT